MDLNRFPGDRELFPQLGQGTRLRQDYVAKLESFRPTIKKPTKEEIRKVKKYQDYSALEDRYMDQNKGLWLKMERWLTQRVLDGNAVDSFPPRCCIIDRSDFKMTSISSRYDEDMDDYDNRVEEQEFGMAFGISNYSTFLTRAMELFEKPNSGPYHDSYIYELVEPLYRALRPYTVRSAVTGFLRSILITGICVLVSWGLDALAKATEWFPLLSIIITLASWAALLVTIGVGIWFVYHIFKFFVDLGKVASMGKLREKAAENVPKVYRMLRFYRLWKQETEAWNTTGMDLMEKYLEEYLEQYPLPLRK